MKYLNYAYWLTIPAGIACIIIGIWVLLKKDRNVPGFWATAIEAIVFGIVILAAVPVLKWLLGGMVSLTAVDALKR